GNRETPLTPSPITGIELNAATPAAFKPFTIASMSSRGVAIGRQKSWKPVIGRLGSGGRRGCASAKLNGPGPRIHTRSRCVTAMNGNGEAHREQTHGRRLAQLHPPGQVRSSVQP